MTAPTYSITVGEYQGPIEKLWELIETRKLEITAVSMAQVTEEFLRHLETLAASSAVARRSLGEGGADGKEASAYLRLLADFIVVASRLILLKSRSLLPDLSLSAAEETDLRDLEHRLRVYRELKPAMRALQALWRQGSRSYGRPYFLRMLHAYLAPGDRTFFFPGEALSVGALEASLRGIADTLASVVVEETLIQEKIVTLEEKIREVIELVGRLDRESFRSLARAKSRSEIIVTFLALLHLAREQLLVIEQDGDHSDIIITRSPAGASAEAGSSIASS